MRVIKVGADGHVFKITSDDSSAVNYYNGVETFSFSAGAIRLARAATASLPDNLEGLLAWDETLGAVVSNDGAGWSQVGAGAYETGDWTPELTDFSDADEGQTYDIQDGKYTLIGNTVHAHCDMKMSGLGTLSGGVYLGGLPYAAAFDAAANVGAIFQVTRTSGESVTGLLNSGDSRIVLYISSGTGSYNGLNVATNLNSTFRIHLSITYQKA